MRNWIFLSLSCCVTLSSFSQSRSRGNVALNVNPNINVQVLSNDNNFQQVSVLSNVQQTNVSFNNGNLNNVSFNERNVVMSRSRGGNLNDNVIAQRNDVNPRNSQSIAIQTTNEQEYEEQIQDVYQIDNDNNGSDALALNTNLNLNVQINAPQINFDLPSINLNKSSEDEPKNKAVKVEKKEISVQPKLSVDLKESSFKNTTEGIKVKSRKTSAKKKSYKGFGYRQHVSISRKVSNKLVNLKKVMSKHPKVKKVCSVVCYQF